MEDFDIFALSLETYLENEKKYSGEELRNKYVEFQESIKNLKCNDFRFYYYRAHYLNSQDRMDEAQYNINQSIALVSSINKDIFYIGENGYHLTAPCITTNKGCRYALEMPPLKSLLSDVYSCAGEIYSKLGEENLSLKYYQIAQYYGAFLKSDFEKQQMVSVFSFRKFNEYSLLDLINNTITVSPSTKMNDPLDSVINLWGNEKRLRNQCKEKKHVKPYSQSFDYYRIRAFCLGKGNSPIKNILMWSHYAGEHTGFCIKYKLSKHFICQEENSDYEHIYLKKIQYTNAKINLSVHSIDSNLAFSTKKKDWRYENEVRLISYNPNNSAPFYGIQLDKMSEIEAIFFGYRCPESTIITIKNIFVNSNIKSPKFYKIVLDETNIYNLKYVRL